MADLVHQHMGHNFAQRVLSVAPIVQQRPAIQPDHIRQFTGLTPDPWARPLPRKSPSRSNSVSAPICSSVSSSGKSSTWITKPSQRRRNDSGSRAKVASARASISARVGDRIAAECIPRGIDHEAERRRGGRSSDAIRAASNRSTRSRVRAASRERSASAATGNSARTFRNVSRGTRVTTLSSTARASTWRSTEA